MSIAVLQAGFFTTVQDLGRAGSREHGVSLGGALDGHALRIANLLVGNDVSAAGLETTLGRVRLRFDEQRVIAWCGGAVDANVGAASVPAGRPVVVDADEELTLTAPARGARAWLAIAGGVDAPQVLGSRGTDLRGQFGGLEGRMLRDGDLLSLGSLSPKSNRLARSLQQARRASWGGSEEWTQTGTRRAFLRVVRGAEWALFDAEAQKALFNKQFTVAEEADRMGARLFGPVLAPREGGELVSEPVAPGTIQVPPNGQPILLLGDCQTIGGYPKIAHVITVDMPIAAQLRPGDPVQFSEVSLKEARALLVQREHDVAWFRAGIAARLS